MSRSPLFHIRLSCEGGTHPGQPDTRPEFAPLMVNPGASAATLIDAAHARVEHIHLIAKPFTFLGRDALSHLPPDAISSVLIAIQGACEEIMALLQAAQYAKPEAGNE